jgi:biopolymer transport protein TolR
MVTAPMMTAGLDVDLPETRSANLEVDESKLLIVIDRNQKVYLGDTEIPAERLEDAIKANERIKTEKEVYIKADESLPYGTVVKLMGILREAGVIKIGMVTNPMEDVIPNSKSEKQ